MSDCHYENNKTTFCYHSHDTDHSQTVQKHIRIHKLCTDTCYVCLASPVPYRAYGRRPSANSAPTARACRPDLAPGGRTSGAGRRGRAPRCSRILVPAWEGARNGKGLCPARDGGYSDQIMGARYLARKGIRNWLRTAEQGINGLNEGAIAHNAIELAEVCSITTPCVIQRNMFNWASGRLGY